MLIISPSKREAFLFCKLLFVRLEFTKYFSDYLFHFYYLLDYPELTYTSLETFLFSRYGPGETLPMS